LKRIQYLESIISTVDHTGNYDIVRLIKQYRSIAQPHPSTIERLFTSPYDMSEITDDIISRLSKLESLLEHKSQPQDISRVVDLLSSIPENYDDTLAVHACTVTWKLLFNNVERFLRDWDTVNNQIESTEMEMIRAYTTVTDLYVTQLMVKISDQLTASIWNRFNSNSESDKLFLRVLSFRSYANSTLHAWIKTDQDVITSYHANNKIWYMIWPANVERHPLRLLQWIQIRDLMLLAIARHTVVLRLSHNSSSTIHSLLEEEYLWIKGLVSVTKIKNIENAILVRMKEISEHLSQNTLTVMQRAIMSDILFLFFIEKEIKWQELELKWNQIETMMLSTKSSTTSTVVAILSGITRFTNSM
jgi:hypothetical protein